MKLTHLMKALLSLLAADITVLGRSERRSPGRPLPGALLYAAVETGKEAEPAAALRIMDVVSALPPAQLPEWFKQRFEGPAVFELDEFRQLSPARRAQLLVLVEKTLDAYACRSRQAEVIGLSRFQRAAQRLNSAPQGKRAAR